MIFLFFFIESLFFFRMKLIFFVIVILMNVSLDDVLEMEFCLFVKLFVNCLKYYYMLLIGKGVSVFEVVR